METKKLKEEDFDSQKHDFFGKKTKTKKGKTDCDECKFNDGSNDAACFTCPDKVGFGYHYE